MVRRRLGYERTVGAFARGAGATRVHGVIHTGERARLTSRGYPSGCCPDDCGAMRDGSSRRKHSSWSRSSGVGAAVRGRNDERELGGGEAGVPDLRAALGFIRAIPGVLRGIQYTDGLHVRCAARPLGTVTIRLAQDGLNREATKSLSGLPAPRQRAVEPPALPGGCVEAILIGRELSTGVCCRPRLRRAGGRLDLGFTAHREEQGRHEDERACGAELHRPHATATWS